MLKRFQVLSKQTFRSLFPILFKVSWGGFDQSCELKKEKRKNGTSKFHLRRKRTLEGCQVFDFQNFLVKKSNVFGKNRIRSTWSFREIVWKILQLKCQNLLRQSYFQSWRRCFLRLPWDHLRPLRWINIQTNLETSRHAFDETKLCGFLHFSDGLVRFIWFNLTSVVEGDCHILVFNWVQVKIFDQEAQGVQDFLGQVPANRSFFLGVNQKCKLNNANMMKQQKLMFIGGHGVGTREKNRTIVYGMGAEMPMVHENVITNMVTNNVSLQRMLLHWPVKFGEHNSRARLGLFWGVAEIRCRGWLWASFLKDSMGLARGPRGTTSLRAPFPTKIQKVIATQLNMLCMPRQMRRKVRQNHDFWSWEKKLSKTYWKM